MTFVVPLTSNSNTPRVTSPREHNAIRNDTRLGGNSATTNNTIADVCLYNEV